ncbi:hypothetical protein CHS0354_037078 [Potamilus streckersoni]|uniref:Uncharacterized protein n=1 Tax=Potamilus streckersoni TaxID=2493646 RepID=A0AAE0SRB4_9BIVA|nr:hypothetical protein CHS0354_037078 [Potamilus streckersoni]
MYRCSAPGNTIACQGQCQECQGSIGQVQNLLLKISKREDNTDMSTIEYDLRQELQAVVNNNDTSRKPTIKAFMEIGEKKSLKVFMKKRVVVSVLNVTNNTYATGMYITYS